MCNIYLVLIERKGFGTHVILKKQFGALQEKFIKHYLCIKSTKYIDKYLKFDQVSDLNTSEYTSKNKL